MFDQTIAGADAPVVFIDHTAEARPPRPMCIAAHMPILLKVGQSVTWRIINGCAALYQELPNGRRLLLDIRGPSRLLGETLVDARSCNAMALDALGPEGKPLKAFFFSIDPERDTPDVMYAYVITGITGKPDEMQKVVNGWIIHASKLPSEDGDYHISHTTLLLSSAQTAGSRGCCPTTPIRTRRFARSARSC